MTLTVFSKPASADTADAGVSDPKPEQVFDIPAGVKAEPFKERGWGNVFNPNEKEYKCFTTTEYQVIANIILDYRWFWGYAMDLETKLKLKDKEIGSLGRQLEIMNHSLEASEGGRANLNTILEREQKLRLDMASSSEFELWLWRGGTIILGLVAAGMAGAYAVEALK